MGIKLKHLALLGFILIIASVSAFQENDFCDINNNCTFAFEVRTLNNVLIDEQICNISFYNTSGSLVLNATMINNTAGFNTYNLNASASGIVNGTYLWRVQCVDTGEIGYATGILHINPSIETYLQSINGTTCNTSGLATQKNITDLENHGDANWNTATGFLTGSELNASHGIGLYNESGGVANVNWTNGSKQIWNYGTRNLTWYNASASNLTAKDVWTYGTRNLTWYNVTGNITVYETDTLSTMPLLVFFYIAWFICFALAFLYFESGDVKKIFGYILAAMFSIMIIAYAPVEIRCVSCAIANVTTVSDLGTMPLFELAYAHIFLFVLELVLAFYYFTQMGMGILGRGKKR